MSIQAMRQALEALGTCGEDEWYTDDNFGMVQTYDDEKVHAAITALRTAIEAADKQEPYARIYETESPFGLHRSLDYRPYNGRNPDRVVPVYTTPPAAQRQPLTDEQLRVIENKINPNMRWRSSDEEGITLYPIEYYELVRAIEAAHGIGEKK